jgi:hypothetical protein
VADAWKPGEIVIGRVDRGAALQCERRDVGIRGEIAGAPGGLQQAAQDRSILLVRCDDLDARLLQPGIRLGKRSGGGDNGRRMMPARVVIQMNARMTI